MRSKKIVTEAEKFYFNSKFIHFAKKEEKKLFIKMGVVYETSNEKLEGSNPCQSSEFLEYSSAFSIRIKQSCQLQHGV